MSTLSDPFRHTLADLFLANEFPTISLAKTLIDFVEQIKSIQGIFDSGVIGEFLNCFQYLLLRRHGTSPFFVC